jgi:hypothetical protein
MQSRLWNVTARGRGSRGAFVVIQVTSDSARHWSACPPLMRLCRGTTTARSRAIGTSVSFSICPRIRSRATGRLACSASRLLGFTPILFDTTLRAGSEWHGAQPRRTVDENRLLAHA